MRYFLVHHSNGFVEKTGHSSESYDEILSIARNYVSSGIYDDENDSIFVIFSQNSHEPEIITFSNKDLFS